MEGRRHRLGLATYAGFIAVSAYFGTVGLCTGWLALGPKLDARLPFDSPVFGGIALAVIVGVPATLVAVLAWRAHPRSRDAATLDGLLLIGWIAVELAFIREFSALQAIYVAAGLGLIAAGGRSMSARVFTSSSGRVMSSAASSVARWQRETHRRLRGR